MKEFTALKALTEVTKPAGKTNRQRADEFFNGVETSVEDLFTTIVGLRKKLQSQVLTDLVRDLGMPVTETKMLKEDVESAYQAIRKLEQEMNDTYMAVATAADAEDEK